MNEFNENSILVYNFNLYIFIYIYLKIYILIFHFQKSLNLLKTLFLS